MMSKTRCAVLVLSLLPLLAGAEVYKWRDKDGSIKYSDTPPPTNVKVEAVGKKAVKPVQAAPIPSGEIQSAPQGATDKAATKAENAKDPAQDAAKLKQRNDEIEKKNKAEKEAQAKIKAENCKAAKANYELYKQGGRVTRMNEKGEREYLDDKQLQDGATEAERLIRENCN